MFEEDDVQIILRLPVSKQLFLDKLIWHYTKGPFKLRCFIAGGVMQTTGFEAIYTNVVVASSSGSV